MQADPKHGEWYLTSVAGAAPSPSMGEGWGGGGGEESSTCTFHPRPVPSPVKGEGHQFLWLRLRQRTNHSSRIRSRHAPDFVGASERSIPDARLGRTHGIVAAKGRRALHRQSSDG